MLWQILFWMTISKTNRMRLLYKEWMMKKDRFLKKGENLQVLWVNINVIQKCQNHLLRWVRRWSLRKSMKFLRMHLEKERWKKVYSTKQSSNQFETQWWKTQIRTYQKLLENQQLLKSHFKLIWKSQYLQRTCLMWIQMKNRKRSSKYLCINNHSCLFLSNKCKFQYCNSLRCHLLKSNKSFNKPLHKNLNEMFLI